MSMNENMKRFRMDAGLTQKALAKKTGLSFSMISKLESGEQANPSLETIRKIADVLRITPGELLNTPLSIEEQIDEYIEYKRGLNKIKTGSDTYGSSEEDCKENSCADIDFRRKLYAINNVPAPSGCRDNEYAAAEDLSRRPDLRKLFSVLKYATKDEINQVTRLIETFKSH